MAESRARVNLWMLARDLRAHPFGPFITSACASSISVVCSGLGASDQSSWSQVPPRISRGLTQIDADKKRAEIRGQKSEVGEVRGPALYELALMPLENEMRFGSIRVLDLPTHFGAGSLKIRDRVTMDRALSGSVELRNCSVMALRSSSERRARSAANAGPILSAAANVAVAIQTK
jgi:hypothetical protein